MVALKLFIEIITGIEDYRLENEYDIFNYRINNKLLFALYFSNEYLRA